MSIHDQQPPEQLFELVEELLDAHCDTVCLDAAASSSPEWSAHVAYLKDLQRVGQRMLADLTTLSGDVRRADLRRAARGGGF